MSEENSFFGHFFGKKNKTVHKNLKTAKKIFCTKNKTTRKTPF